MEHKIILSYTLIAKPQENSYWKQKKQGKLTNYFTKNSMKKNL